MFDAKPKDPTMTTSRGCEISKDCRQNFGGAQGEGLQTWSREEPFYGLQEDGETECKEEHAVDEGCENFSSMPAVGVLFVYVGLVRELHEGGQLAPHDQDIGDMP